ncbi:MAG: Rrf2 family transcriptional regulator [Candidatus Sulfomarinibacteraceae bacterium]
MRVSKSEEYGLRLVMALAVSGEQLTIRELAEREELPDTTVAKIVGRLRRVGLVEAVRGRNGGYTLTRSADEISLAEVVSAFEAEVFSSDFCHTMSPGDGICAKSTDCGLRPVWRGLRNVIGNFLEGITVADIVSGGRKTANDLLPVLATHRN